MCAINIEREIYYIDRYSSQAAAHERPHVSDARNTSTRCTICLDLDLDLDSYICMYVCVDRYR